MSIAELRAIASNGQESVRLQDLRRYAANDEEYQQLKASSSTASQTVATSYQKDVSDTGATSLWMRTLSFLGVSY